MKGDHHEHAPALTESPAECEPDSVDAWFPVLYTELRGLARQQRRNCNNPAQSGTTSIVHEAYERLSRSKTGQVGSRGRFFALAAKVMRSIVVDNARRWQSLRRGSEFTQVNLNINRLVSAEHPEQMLDLDQALRDLEALEPRLADVVDCRIFGGLSVVETAEATGTSTATVKRDWRLARNWLYRHLRIPADSP